ncbi:MAG TPA: DUF1844 domain-containing protein [Thermoanaerobaculia bacterium]|nr:DUF1844 domain-containing protein [Thermoanaerobaculia bacterium]
MAEEEEKPIRVVDRRMFTADGELRPEYQSAASEPAPSPAPTPAAAPPPPASPPPPAAEERPSEPPPSDEPAGGEPRTAFALIIQMLAMPAYAALGMVPDPASGRQRVDRAAAREMIDLLAVLEQKTRGNLSFEESNFLSRVLYDLRLAFVEVSRPPAK